MAMHFLSLALTPDVKAAQERYYGRSLAIAPSADRDHLGSDETEFIEGMDSFYLASVNQAGWPYLQHRGGPKGFLKVLSPSELGFADFNGNRQLLTTGNVARDGRVCLFLMHYPMQARLKLLCHVEVLAIEAEPALAKVLIPPGMARDTERLFRFQIEGFDWNCPKHITPRFTESEVAAAIRPLHDRIAALEAEVARLKH